MGPEKCARMFAVANSGSRDPKSQMWNDEQDIQLAGLVYSKTTGGILRKHLVCMTVRHLFKLECQNCLEL